MSGFHVCNFHIDLLIMSEYNIHILVYLTAKVSEMTSAVEVEMPWVVRTSTTYLLDAKSALRAFRNSARLSVAAFAGLVVNGIFKGRNPLY